jgi:hypothetical protein
LQLPLLCVGMDCLDCVFIDDNKCAHACNSWLIIYCWGMVSRLVVMENMTPIVVLLVVCVAGMRSCGMAITSVSSIL